MLTETVRLESLRQKIEEAEYEAGNQSDYLDRGKPNAAQAKEAGELIEKLNRQSKALKEEFRQLIATVRSQQPQALEEWINFHTGILQKIIEKEAKGSTRQFVAKNTLQEWEKVRAGENEYVSINWHYLKDYKASVRNIRKAWWQFWR